MVTAGPEWDNPRRGVQPPSKGCYVGFTAPKEREKPVSRRRLVSRSDVRRLLPRSACPGAGVREGRPCYRDELPVVRAGMERQLQDAERRGIPDCAVGDDAREGPEVVAARSDDELPDSRRIRDAARVLRREPLVVVVVAVEDDVGARGVEVAPERVDRRVAAMFGPRRKARLVPVRELALIRVRGE